MARIHTILQSLLAVTTATLLAFAPASAADPFELEWTEVADGVWAGVRPNSPRIPVMGTSTIIIGDDGVLLFDAGGAPLQSERVLAKVRELTDEPVTHIVISHWHGDHHLGVHRILDAYPDAAVVSHAFTAAAMAGAPMDYIKPQIEDGFTAVKEALGNFLETKEFPDGRPVPEELIDYYQTAYEDADLIDEQMRAFVVSTPTVTFENDFVIDLGGREVQLKHLGWGNTKGDIVLWLPEERVAASADIVVMPTPYGFGSYPEKWVQSLNNLKALNYETLIPGHGPLQTDTAYVDLLIETMTLIHKQVAPLAAEGLSLEEVREQVDFSSVEARFTKGSTLLESRFDAWFKTPIVEAAYNVATGVENEKLEREEEAPAEED